MPSVVRKLFTTGVAALASVMLLPFCAFSNPVLKVGGVAVALGAGGAFAGVDAGTGYGYAGNILEGAACAGGGVVGVQGDDICLTNFNVNGGNGVGGALAFDFMDVFAALPGPPPAGYFASDVMNGGWLPPLPPNADTIDFVGKAGAPPAVIPRGVPPCPVVAPAAIRCNGGQVGILPGMAFTLEGIVTVTLIGVDGVNLPNSAEVYAFAPEPGALELLSVAALCLVPLWIHRRFCSKAAKML